MVGIAFLTAFLTLSIKNQGPGRILKQDTVLPRDNEPEHALVPRGILETGFLELGFQIPSFRDVQGGETGRIQNINAVLPMLRTVDL